MYRQNVIAQVFLPGGGIVEWLQCRLLFILCIARRAAECRVNGNNIARQNNNYFISQRRTPMKRINAIYARQSVDRADSISIESQIEFCKYELKGGSFKEYKDKGYSGKNTVRPQLQQLLTDIRRGEVEKVIVYKLDRISRSILDFSNMMNLFQQYQVEFVSSTEKFDTSTPMGRAMLNICIVFAQLERETIQKRVSDAYYSRSQKGFRMGGKPPYGYRLEEILMEGIHTKKLVEEPGEAAIVREIFDMYEQPDTSYGDITRYYAEKGVQFYGKELIRSMLAQLLRNPVYVRADMDVYRFFRSHGTNIVSSPEQFDGIHGCYLYQGRDAQTDKLQNLKGHMLVVAPHEGLVSSEQWLNCRIKLMRNKTIQANRKAVNTWLAGKVKCGNCGYALMSIKIQSGKQYLRCTKRLNNKACPGCGKVYTEDVENYVYKEMVRKLREGQSPAAYTKLKENPQVKQIYREIEEMEKEISLLVDSLAGAGETLTDYINQRVEEIDQIHQLKLEKLSVLAENHATPEQMEKVASNISLWGEIDFEEKRFTVDKMIRSLKVFPGSVQIQWKF